MKKTLILILIAVAMIAAPISAGAATLTYTDSIGLQDVDWSDVLSVQKFDDSLGVLLSIDITLTGELSGFAKYQNTGPSAGSATLNLKAQLLMTAPGATVLLISQPLVANTDSYEAANNLPNTFIETDGHTWTGLYTSLNVNNSYSSPGDLAAFTTTGTGFIALPVDAIGLSNASGGGTIVYAFDTNAGAGVEVTYNYSVVPEPISSALFLVGAATLGFRRFRKV